MHIHSWDACFLNNFFQKRILFFNWKNRTKQQSISFSSGAVVKNNKLCVYVFLLWLAINIWIKILICTSLTHVSLLLSVLFQATIRQLEREIQNTKNNQRAAFWLEPPASALDKPLVTTLCVMMRYCVNVFFIKFAFGPLRLRATWLQSSVGDFWLAIGDHFYLGLAIQNMTTSLTTYITEHDFMSYLLHHALKSQFCLMNPRAFAMDPTVFTFTVESPE